MPLIENSTFSPPLLLRNRHIQTCIPTLFRRVRNLTYQREKLITPDNDFLDLDWSRIGSRKLVVVSHGLEGSSNGIYVRGLVRTMNEKGWDALAWNFRGCGGEPNTKIYNYHSGKSEDLESVVDHALSRNYAVVGLVGFSVGGNITLKYLAEHTHSLPKEVQAAVVFSVPCDLAECAKRLEQPENRIYLKRFISMLHDKIREKHDLFPGELDISDLHTLDTFTTFDNRYTAPLNGFRNASEYWSQASSLPLLSHISLPTLMISARDDTFLGPKCFPSKIASEHKYLYLETPSKGGHVGFTDLKQRKTLWSERRALEFLESWTQLQ